MEHSRLALAHLGAYLVKSIHRNVGLMHIRTAKLTYSQLTEILNSHMSRGLPPNLSVNEPSIDYSLKVADVAAASYLSGTSFTILVSSRKLIYTHFRAIEIAYLANPVSTHVVSAEMHNQSVLSEIF